LGFAPIREAICAFSRRVLRNGRAAQPVLVASQEEDWMSSDLADRIQTEITAVREEIESERTRAKRHVENVAVEAEIAQRLRALHTRLDELERNLEQCSSSNSA
jgi:hypothetical protein